MTVAEVRAALRPGEAFFKITEIRNYAFGILIDEQGAQIYRIARNNSTINALAARVRNSIDGGDDDKLPVFDVAAARAVFQLVTGPVEARLLSAKTLIVDPSGPLERLPIGVLVSDQASVDRFKASRLRDRYDYSQVNFLSRRLVLSSALSPRSLTVARSLPESNAPLPFIGFAEHMPVAMSSEVAGQMISIGSGCQVEQSAIAALSRELSPIDKRELVRAGNALGLAETPMMTGAAFSDTAVIKRTDLDQFQVLHFATHGLTEGQWGCAKSPPALVTSMGDAGSDGILSFNEIARLRLNANLVVLSACETASGLSQEEARAAGPGGSRHHARGAGRVVPRRQCPRGADHLLADLGRGRERGADRGFLSLGAQRHDRRCAAQRADRADEFSGEFASDLLGRVLHRRRCQQAAALRPRTGAVAGTPGRRRLALSGLTFPGEPTI